METAAQEGQQCTQIWWPRFVAQKERVAELQNAPEAEGPVSVGVLQTVLRDASTLSYFILRNGDSVKGGESPLVLAGKAFKMLMRQKPYTLIEDEETPNIPPELVTTGLTPRQALLAKDSPKELSGNILFALARMNSFRPPPPPSWHDSLSE
ncbi:uncharacterized protein LOC132196346 [Neocloeon triangulifer]|uniref:uncharacterized protein LOC132196346 n=1 Tax=Neocloeon triangulifer TaxID=2078957 RepID=UPI00286F3496|nr:uncharacterized protein LOC132196346 [Neocloeon triangulifer]